MQLIFAVNPGTKRSLIGQLELLIQESYAPRQRNEPLEIDRALFSSRHVGFERLFHQSLCVIHRIILQQIQNHSIAWGKLRMERFCTRSQKSCRCRRAPADRRDLAGEFIPVLEFFIQYDAMSTRILPKSPCPSRHLQCINSGERVESMTVQCGYNCGPCWHVNARCQGVCCKYDFYQPVLEERFDERFPQRKQACMMTCNSLLKQRLLFFVNSRWVFSRGML